MTFIVIGPRESGNYQPVSLFMTLKQLSKNTCMDSFGFEPGILFSKLLYICVDTSEKYTHVLIVKNRLHVIEFVNEIKANLI